MQRISCAFFMLALVLYYIPKVFKVKKSKYLKLHITTGTVSIIAMVLAMIQTIGQADFIKYIGFALIMILIGITGYLINRKYKLYRILHIAFTISFFVYIYISIKVF